MLSVLPVTDMEEALLRIEKFHHNTPVQNPFIRPGWLRTWWEHTLPSGTPEILFFVDESGQTVGYAPFLVKKVLFVAKRYSLMGEGTANSLQIATVVPHHSILETLEAYFEQQKQPVVVRLYDIDQWSPLAETLASRPDFIGVELYPCPLVELGDGWEAYVRERLNSKRRGELARMERRLSTMGPVKTTLISDPQGLSANRGLVDQLFDLHRTRFHKVLNTSGFSDPFQRPFYELLFKRSAEDGSLYLSVMTLDGRAVSFVLGLRCGNRVIDMIPAFEPALAAFGIGHLHLYQILRQLPEQGITIFDFSKGDSTYKSKWATSVSRNLCFWGGFGLGPMTKLLYTGMVWETALRTSLRRRGVLARVKRILGVVRALRTRSSGGAEPPKSSKTGGTELTRAPIRYALTVTWSGAVREAVYSAIAKGATATVEGSKVEVKWPDDRVERYSL